MTTSEPGSAAMEQFKPLEKVFIRWARGADGSLNIRKWSQFPFDGATEYGDPVVLTRERDEAREALKPFAATALAIDQNRPAVRLDDDEKVWVRVGDLRHARAALAGGKQE